MQQNKHLHSVCLNNQEGKFILETIKNYSDNFEPTNDKSYDLKYDKSKVDQKFIADKNRLYKKLIFSSESDLEAFIILCLKNKQDITYNLEMSYLVVFLFIASRDSILMEYKPLIAEVQQWLNRVWFSLYCS